MEERSSSAMFFDHSLASRVDNLEKYYTELCALQEEAHGEGYLLVHDEIRRLLRPGEAYTELGVNQGTTLAAAMLAGASKVTGVDISLMPYNHAKGLFKAYAQERGVELTVFEADTLKVALSPCDVLYIDTVHKYEHLSRELQRHGGVAKKYIIFHDTVYGRGLDRAIQEWVATNPEWEVITTCKKNVGFMTVGRK